MEIIERIDRWGRTTPDRPAYISGGRTLTYGELCRTVRRPGRPPGRLAPGRSPVVVLGHKEPELLIAFLGAIKSGRAYVPVDMAVPPQRIGRIVAASGAAAHPDAGDDRRALRRPRPAPPWRLETG